MQSTVVAVGACLLSAAAAYGQVGLVAQARSVPGSPPASGFGFYSASSSGGSSSLAQTSDLSVTGATFDLSAGGSGSGAGGQTNLSFTFEVFTAVQFTLSGTIAFYQGPEAGTGGGTVRLLGPGTDLQGPAFGIFATLPYSFSGTLNPGIYTLTADAHGMGVNGHNGSPRAGGGRTIGTLTLTPTPGAAAALLMGAAAGLSRRRR
jgi:hypothetical protein